MDSYTNLRVQCCGCRHSHTACPRPAQEGCTQMPDYPEASPSPWNSWEPSGAWPQTTPPMSDHYWPQNDQIPAYLCTQTAPGPLEQNYPAAMAYVPWQQWQATYAPERGLAQGTIFPEMDLQFNYGRCSR